MRNNNRKKTAPLTRKEMEILFRIQLDWKRFFNDLASGTGVFSSEKERQVGIAMAAEHCVGMTENIMNAVWSANDKRIKVRLAKAANENCRIMKKLWDKTMKRAEEVEQ